MKINYDEFMAINYDDWTIYGKKFNALYLQDICGNLYWGINQVFLMFCARCKESRIYISASFFLHRFNVFNKHELLDNHNSNMGLK